MSYKCLILFPSDFRIHEHEDKNGCIKPEGHLDAHVFIDHNGDRIEWQDDENCNCGCWDLSFDEDNICKTYQNLGKPTAENAEKIKGNERHKTKEHVAVRVGSSEGRSASGLRYRKRIIY